MTNVCGNFFLVGVGTLLLADTIPDSGFLQHTVQYSALGILGWAVWYMLAKAFPQHLKAQQEERKVLLEAHLEAQKNTRKEFQDALETILEIVRER